MEPIIKVDNVSMCFNLSKEKHESLKEYFLAMVQGRLQYDEFYALKDGLWYSAESTTRKQPFFAGTRSGRS